MRYITLFLALAILGCSRPKADLLSEPSANSSLRGRLYTVGDMRELAPITSVKIDPGLNSDRIQHGGSSTITTQNFEQVMTAGKPITPDDGLLDKWNYAPWYSATFVSGGRRWSVELFLGGIGFITDDAGRKGAFRFE